MAKRDEQDDDADRSPDGDDDADEREADESGASDDEASSDEAEASDDDAASDEGATASKRSALAKRGGIEVGDDLADRVGGEGEADEPHAVHGLGAQRYVIAAFLVATMLGAYVLGLTVHGVWSWASNRDFFALRLPAAAAVPDESKMTYGTIFGAVVALAYAVKQYRDPEVRAWTDDVAAELTKVKWPSQKDVTNSTIVVIAASAFAMVYLFLLDRLWGFVTGLIYGAGT